MADLDELRDYDPPIRLLHSKQDVVRAMEVARRDFLARLTRGGLTVTSEAASKWWPVDRQGVA